MAWDGGYQIDTSNLTRPPSGALKIKRSPPSGAFKIKRVPLNMMTRLETHEGLKPPKTYKKGFLSPFRENIYHM